MLGVLSPSSGNTESADEAIIEEILAEKPWWTPSYRFACALRRFCVTIFVLPFLCSIALSTNVTILLLMIAVLVDVIANKFAPDLDDRRAIKVIVKGDVEKGCFRKKLLLPVFIGGILIIYMVITNFINSIIFYIYLFVVLLYFIYTIIIFCKMIGDSNGHFFYANKRIDVKSTSIAEYNTGPISFIFKYRLFLIIIQLMLLCYVWFLCSIDIVGEGDNVYRNYAVVFGSLLVLLISLVVCPPILFKYQDIAKSYIAKLRREGAKANNNPPEPPIPAEFITPTR